MSLIEKIYVKLDDGRVLESYEYSYDEFLKVIASDKFINIGNEMIVSSHIVSFWREY